MQVLNVISKVNEYAKWKRPKDEHTQIAGEGPDRFPTSFAKRT